MKYLFKTMKSWFFWAGVGLIIGGVTSLGLNLGVQETVTASEDYTGYSFAWIAVGIAFIIFGFVKKQKEEKS